MVARQMGLVHRVGWDARFSERSPWLWPLRSAAAALREHADWPGASALQELCRVPRAEAGLPPLRLAPNVDKRDKRVKGRVVLDALYDARIAVHGELPTRERDWHDLFNVLCFATFPRSKQALHARQYEALARRMEPGAATLPGARTREQDALTLFDEGGVIVACSPELRDTLAAVGDALGDALNAVPPGAQLAVIPFGHALHEHMVEGLMMPGARASLVTLSDAWPASAAELVAAADQAFAPVVASAERFQSPAEHVHLRLGALAPHLASGPFAG